MVAKGGDPVKTSMNPVLNIINCLVSFIYTEGSSSDEQVGFFVRLLQENGDIELIAETGFNTGVSSSAFLAARPDTTVVSFDIGQHRTVSLWPSELIVVLIASGR